VTLGRGWGWTLGAALASGLLTGCAAPEPTPLLRDDFTRIRADLTRIEQSIQRGQAEIKADLQRADRQSAQILTELQKSVAQLGARLDDLGRDAAQIQGRKSDYQPNFASGKEPLPQFIYLYLPNDHTAQPRPEDGFPYTASYVADNDLALGKVVELLSHSPFWKDMAIIVPVRSERLKLEAARRRR